MKNKFRRATYWLFFVLFQVALLRREFRALHDALKKKEEELCPLKKNDFVQNIWTAQGEKAPPEVQTFGDIVENTWKHVNIVVLLLLQLLTTVWEVGSLDRDALMVIMPICLGITTTMGVAWYVISFGAVPKRHLDTAFSVTFFMCWAFCASLLMFVEVTCPLAWAVALFLTVWIVIIAMAVYIAGVLYDTMDLLKAGIDEAALSYYRAGTPAMQSQHELFLQIKRLADALERQKEE